MDLQIFKEIDLFRTLDPLHLAHLASIVTERRVAKDEIIFEEGDSAEEFYVIYRGRVRISKVVPGMGEEPLAVLNQGAYFGEMELVDRALPRVARATAHEDCILQTFNFDAFDDLLKADKELALAILWNMVRTLCQRLTETDNKVAATFAMAQFQ